MRFSKEQLMSLKPCATGVRAVEWATRHGPVTVREALGDGLGLHQALWALTGLARQQRELDHRERDFRIERRLARWIEHVMTRAGPLNSTREHFLQAIACNNRERVSVLSHMVLRRAPYGNAPGRRRAEWYGDRELQRAFNELSQAMCLNWNEECLTHMANHMIVASVWNKISWWQRLVGVNTGWIEREKEREGAWQRDRLAEVFSDINDYFKD